MVTEIVYGCDALTPVGCSTTFQTEKIGAKEERRPSPRPSTPARPSLLYNYSRLFVAAGNTSVCCCVYLSSKTVGRTKGYGVCLCAKHPLSVGKMNHRRHPAMEGPEQNGEIVTN